MTLRTPCLAALLLGVLGLSPAPSAVAVLDLPTGDRRAYDTVELAASAGLARPGDTATLPLDDDRYLEAFTALRRRGLVDARGDALLARQKARGDGGLHLEGLMPRWTLRTYGLAADGHSRTLYHSSGDTLGDGFNAFLAADGSAAWGDWIGAGYELQLQRRPGDFLYRTKRLWAKGVWGKWSFKFGRDAERLGVGYHGSLLLDDTSATLDLWRVRTEEPLFLPGALSILGGFRFTLFNAYLSDSNPRPADERYGSGVNPVEDPRLLGMRFSYHPTSWLDLGLGRAVLYGGVGRESYDTPTDWWELFTGKNENVHAGESDRYDNDQYASLDIAVRLPALNGVGPLKGGKLYWEYGGTDIISKWQGESTGGIAPFKFDDVANLGGIYLSTAVTDLRVEYAQTSKAWYRHGQYSQGYTYRGIPLGHHMGGDATNWYFELGRYFGFRHRAALGLDLEERGRSLPQSEKRSEWSLRWDVRELELFGITSVGALDVRIANIQNPLDDSPDREDRNEYYLGLGLQMNL